MATIEERARRHALAAVYGDENDSLYKDIETECIKLATEQREIDIQKAEDWYCNNMCEYLKTHGGGCDWIQHGNCDIPERIRKAIIND